MKPSLAHTFFTTQGRAQGKTHHDVWHGKHHHACEHHDKHHGVLEHPDKVERFSGHEVGVLGACGKGDWVWEENGGDWIEGCTKDVGMHLREGVGGIYIYP